MSKFQTVETLNAKQAEHEQRHSRSSFAQRYREPDADERLFVSNKISDGKCLTHLTRHVSEHYRKDGTALTFRHASFTGWCGVTMGTPDLVPVEEETFGCHKCIEFAERYDAPTFNLIPNTGCEVSEGRRWKPRR